MTTLADTETPVMAVGGRVSRICFGLILATYLILTTIDFTYTVDDPLITYRYARNLAGGHGLVFNPGERVEGYTSFLHALLMSVVYLLLPAHGLLIGKLLSVGFGAAMLYTLYRLGQRLFGADSVGALCAPLLLATSWRYTHSCVNGMETMLTALLLVLGVWRLLEEYEGRRRGIGSAVYFAGACLSRPETMLLLPVVIGLRRKAAPETQATFGRWLLTLLLPVLGLFVFRGIYYGALLPNTFYAKGMPLGAALPEGARYVVLSLFPPAALPLWLALGWRVWREKRVPRFIAALGGMALLWSLAVLRSGGDMFPWEKRYMAPILPLAYLTLAWGLGAFRFAGASKPSPALVYGGTGALALFIAAFNTRFFTTTVDSFVIFRHRGALTDENLLRTCFRNSYWLKTADWVRQNVPPGATVAFTEMGATPFLNPKVSFIDLRGLTDRAIARHPELADRHKNYGIFAPWHRADSPLGKYLLQRRPDYILDYDWQAFQTPLRALDDAYQIAAGPLYWWEDADKPEYARRQFVIWKRSLR